MNWPHVLGTVRYFQGLGYSYAEMLKGSMTASAAVTYMATKFGIGIAGTLVLALGSVVLWQVLALGFGWLVWRWRIVHAELERARDNSPATSEQLALLREIAKNTRVGQGNPGYRMGCASHAGRACDTATIDTLPSLVNAR